MKFAYLNSNMSELENILKRGYFLGIMIVSHYLAEADTVLGALYVLSHLILTVALKLVLITAFYI